MVWCSVLFLAESSLNDESYANGSQSGNVAAQYATSLPVSMPGWQRSRHSSEEDELMKVLVYRVANTSSITIFFPFFSTCIRIPCFQVPMPVDPQEMAASIKAMARSVKCSDGTEMFGELPDHKLNTADIALSCISTFNKKHWVCRRGGGCILYIIFIHCISILKGNSELLFVFHWLTVFILVCLNFRCSTILLF